MSKKHYGHDIDYSKMDWMIAKGMATKGYKTESIKNALSEHSPEISTRKQGHAEDYVNRTVDKVMKLPEVQQELKISRDLERTLEIGGFER